MTLKNKCLVLLLFGFSQVVGAQAVFCPPGATWHYEQRALFGYMEGVVEFKYTHDTVIQNRVCKLIKRTFKGKEYPFSPTGTVIPVAQRYAVNQSGAAILLFNGADFDTIVNFNAAIGDKWLEYKRPNSLGCHNSRGYYVVTDTGRIMINNLNLKKISASYFGLDTTLTPAKPYTKSSVFVERLLLQGGQALLNSFYELFDFNCYFPGYDGPQGWFRCYTDNTFPVYNTSNVSCESLVNIDESFSATENIKVFPNPAHNAITIKTDKEITLLITNLIGQETYREELKPGENNIAINHLKSGVYILQLNSQGHKVLAKKLLVE